MTAPINGSHDEIPEVTPGDRIAMALRKAGLRVGDLAIELDVERSTVSRWINDRHKRPVPTVYLKLIALRTGVPYEWLRTGSVPTSGSEATPPTHQKGADRWPLFASESAA